MRNNNTQTLEMAFQWAMRGEKKINLLPFNKLYIYYKLIYHTLRLHYVNKTGIFNFK